MKIKNLDYNNIVLDYGVIYIQAQYCGELGVILRIGKTDELYDCESIEEAFSKYCELTKDF